MLLRLIVPPDGRFGTDRPYATAPELVARHLDDVKTVRAAVGRAARPPAKPGLDVMTGTLGDDQEVLFVVTARLVAEHTVEIRNIALMAGP